jgi:hypothetical protein
LASDFCFFFFSGDFAFVVETSIYHDGGRASIFGGPLKQKGALPPLLACGPKERRVLGLPPKEAASRSPTPGRRSGMWGPGGSWLARSAWACSDVFWAK